MKGYVYVVSNRAYPGLVKVGKARWPKARLKQLSGATGILYPFKMEAVFKSADYTLDEQRAHKALGQFRVNPHKEFFRVSPAQAIVELTKLFGEAQYTRAKHKAAQEAYKIQAREEQAEVDRRLEAARLKRQQEVQMLKQKQKIGMRWSIVLWSIFLVVLICGIIAVREICLLTQ